VAVAGFPKGTRLAGGVICRLLAVVGAGMRPRLCLLSQS